MTNHEILGRIRLAEHELADAVRFFALDFGAEADSALRNAVMHTAKALGHDSLDRMVDDFKRRSTE
ncbi:MAG TPA: hypothetical protein VM782_04305 [Stellaceae bacterium]|nr:hypothetical protein [Stellaceae bacterium]